MQYIARLVRGLFSYVVPRAVKYSAPDTRPEPGPGTLTQPRLIGGRSDLASGHSSAFASETRTGFEAAERVPRLPKGEVRELPVRFDGDPAEYARLWWQCAALVVLTAGLAWPWACGVTRRWRLQHTRVAGHELVLEVPWQLLLLRDLPGLALLVGVVGSLAGGSAWLAAAAVVLACAVVPVWLHLRWHDALRHVSWWHRQLAFDGTLTELYQVLGPALLSSACLGLACLALCQAHAGWGAWLLWAGATALALASLPRLWWRWLAYRQHHLRFGPLRMKWQGHRAVFWRLGLRVMAWSALVMLALGGVMLLGLSLVSAATGRMPSRGAQLQLLVCWVLGSLLIIRTFLHARLHNLAWNHTGCRHLRFRSRLDVAGYVAMRLRHAALVVLSGGVYWPWASVAAWRARVEAVAVHSRVEPAVLAEHWRPRVSPDSGSRQR